MLTSLNERTRMSDALIHATNDSFQKDVLEASSSGPVLVDFWAEWCGPCKMIAPHLEELAAAGKSIVKVDIESNEDLANQFQIVSIPTIAVFKDGKEVERLVGGRSKEELQNMIERHES